MSTIDARVVPLVTGDGHHFELIARVPASPARSLLWLPAMGVPARHYLPFAEALASRDVAVFLHEWRGIGSSSLRAGKDVDWGYRELLVDDLAASVHAVQEAVGAGPRVIGGHSLGGQLAACHLACSPNAAQALWLVASGAPFWRAFPAPRRHLLPPLYRFMAWLSRVRGALPGRRLGFAGNEAAGVIADWSQCGLHGRYVARGLDIDLDAALRTVDVPVRAIGFEDDWLGPRSSLAFLLDKVAIALTPSITYLDSVTLGVEADHFAWMRCPDAVVERLLAHG